MGGVLSSDEEPTAPPRGRRWRRVSHHSDPREAIRDYRRAADEYGLRAGRFGFYPDHVDALVRRLDAVLQAHDGGDRSAVPVRLGPEEWRAVWQINDEIRGRHRDVVDRFLALVVPDDGTAAAAAARVYDPLTETNREFMEAAEAYAARTAAATGQRPVHVDALLRQMGAVMRGEERMPHHLEENELRGAHEVSAALLESDYNLVWRFWFFWGFGSIETNMAESRTAQRRLPPPISPTSAGPRGGIRYTVYWYWHRAFIEFSSPADRRDAGVDDLLRRLERMLRENDLEDLQLSPDEWRAVQTINAAVERKDPGCVDRFMHVLSLKGAVPARVRPRTPPADTTPSARLRPKIPPTDTGAAGAPPISPTALKGIKHAVYWYRHWALKGFPTAEDRRDAGIEGLLRRLDGVLRGEETGELYLSPDERRAVRTMNAVVDQKSPGCVDRFMYYVASEDKRPPLPPSTARWQQARGSVTAARTPEERRRIVAAYRKAADEYGAHGEKWSGYPESVDSLVRKLDAVLEDVANDRRFPIYLDAQQWRAVRNINGSSRTVSPDVVDQFVALLGPEPSGGDDAGRMLRSFGGEADWERRLRRRY